MVEQINYVFLLLWDLKDKKELLRKMTSTGGEPGAAINITVRGPGGVRTGSTPLFVIDGLRLDISSTG